MQEIDFKITGLDQLDRALRELPPKAARRIVRETASEAAEPWADEMRAIVRRGPHHRAGGGDIDFGLLADNIIEKTTVRNDLSATVKVGPAATAGSYQLFWAGLLEFGRSGGTSPHGRRYPSAPPYPFVRPAFESQKADVLDRYVTGVRSALNAAGLKLT